MKMHMNMSSSTILYRRLIDWNTRMVQCGTVITWSNLVFFKCSRASYVCLLWVQALINVLSRSLQCFLYCRVLLYRVITTPLCMCIISTVITRISRVHWDSINFVFVNIPSTHSNTHAYQLFHDDVIKWKHFPRYWPFVREFTGPRWIPRTKASEAELWCVLWSASE